MCSFCGFKERKHTLFVASSVVCSQCFYVPVPVKGTLWNFINKDGSKCFPNYIKRVIDFFQVYKFTQLSDKHL